MASPGQSTIATELGTKVYTVYTADDEIDVQTQFDAQSVFIQKLATAMDDGWESGDLDATPTTSTVMKNTFSTEFATYLAGSGLTVVNCIAAAIDAEVDKWVASYEPTTDKHGYTPASDNIVSAVQDCAPIWSNGIRAITEAAASVFTKYFEQEGG